MEGQVDLLQTLKNHTSDITSCDFAAGCSLASGSMDKTVRIWEWKPGLGYVEMSFSPLCEHKYGVTYVSFSPQGTMLASCSRDGSTILWNTRNGTQIHKFPQVNGDSVRICKFSADSYNLATAGDNGIVCIWNLIHRTLLRTIQHHEDTVQSLSYTFDSMYFVTACTQGVLKLYSVEDIRDTTIEDPMPLLSLDDAHDLGVLCCDFCNVFKSDERSSCTIYTLATGGNDHCLRQWNVYCYPAQKEINSSAKIDTSFIIKEAHSSAITCIRYNQQGNMLCSTSIDKTIRFWNLEGICTQFLDAHNRYVNCVAFSRDGLIFCSGSNDKVLKIWDLTGGTLNVDTEIAKPCTVLSHFGCGDLKGISSIQEDNILMKNNPVENEVMLKQVLENLHFASINAIEFNSEGFIATGSGDKSVCLVKATSEDIFTECENSPLRCHHYQINGITFLSPTLLASCSLDGNIAMWMIDQINSRPLHMLTRSYAGVKCVRSNGNFLAAAYDDGSTALWGSDPIKTTPIIVYPEHAEAATSCAFSSDSKLVCSASHNGDFRLYQIFEKYEYCETEPVYVQDNAHDLGIQSVDFSPRNDDIPIQYPEGMICHLLATCGNDSYARIWKIIIPKEDDLHHRVTCTEWRMFSGHGSSLTSIRFPPNRGDLVGTTSTDMQARIWSVYSGQCLHVLEHSALVACCSFSYNGNYFATGCLDGKLFIWKLPSQLIYDSDVTKFIVWNAKNVTEWTSDDIEQWLKEISLGKPDNMSVTQQLIVKVHINNLTGKQLVGLTDEQIFNIFNIASCNDNEIVKNFMSELQWLRRTLLPINLPHVDIPHQFLCPITHDMMKDPVKCSDGFTYERRAINEWFLSGGKFVSPMTNQALYNSEITPNRELKKEIRKFLYKDVQ
ncbi:WD repeat, SAM and U-box domain-containing protein 1-like [Arctopsyche grandis]|uniref:WD repeat, SAM and U-box domain-containing protein 1-like n=1 Tax=Arctopsyche grandis TaxID=121162 RepID=UPI00406D9D60